MTAKMQHWISICLSRAPHQRLYLQSNGISSLSKLSTRLVGKKSSQITPPMPEQVLKLQASKCPKIHWGRTPLQPNKLRTEFQSTPATWEPKRRWPTVSSSTKHIGQALTKILFLRQRLSTVRILPCRANQVETNTLGGAFIFQSVDGLMVEKLPAIAEKKEATEKPPSWDAGQTLFSSISFGI